MQWLFYPDLSLPITSHLPSSPKHHSHFRGLVTVLPVTAPSLNRTVTRPVNMGSLRFGDFADSPAMILPPPQHSFDPVSSYHHSLQRYHSYAPIMPMDTSHDSQVQPAFTSSSSIINPSPVCNKRKRNNFNDVTKSSLHHHQQQTTTPPSLTAWDEGMYGEGTTLVHTSPCCSMTTGSHIGERPTSSVQRFCELTFSVDGFPGYNHPNLFYDTKLHESAKTTAQTQSLCADEEPIVPPRQKYQRHESSTVKAASSPQAIVAEPVIDHFSHLLGVGWNRIGSDPDTQAATRGWARYIENHYHLSDVDILLTSKAFEGACLVCARNGAHKGYFLFSEDLGRARLVAFNWDVCVGRLQSSSRTFETEEMLMAGSTPTLGAAKMGGGACTMLPRSDVSLGALPADVLMIFD